MVDEIHPEVDRWVERDRQRAVELAAIIIAGIGLLLGIISLVIASMSMVISLDAVDETNKTRIELNARYDELDGKHSMTQAYVFSLKAELLKQGFEPPKEEK